MLIFSFNIVFHFFKVGDTWSNIFLLKVLFLLTSLTYFRFLLYKIFTNISTPLSVLSSQTLGPYTRADSTCNPPRKGEVRKRLSRDRVPGLRPFDSLRRTVECLDPPFFNPNLWSFCGTGGRSWGPCDVWFSLIISLYLLRVFLTWVEVRLVGVQVCVVGVWPNSFGRRVDRRGVFLAI